MEPIEWTLSETFQFPAEAGMVAEADSVKVTAGYEDKQTVDAVRLSGIYHIAATVTFGSGSAADAAALAQDAVLIDDVEVDGEKGYFEYAVPLQVDLPAAGGADVTARVIEASASATDSGGLLVMWTVQASAKEEAVQAAADGQQALQAAGDTAEQPSGPAAVLDDASAAKDGMTAAAVLDADSSSVTLAAVAAADVGGHEMLAFIRDLEDGVSVTPFELNNVAVE